MANPLKVLGDLLHVGFAQTERKRVLDIGGRMVLKRKSRRRKRCCGRPRRKPKPSRSLKTKSHKAPAAKKLLPQPRRPPQRSESPPTAKAAAHPEGGGAPEGVPRRHSRRTGPCERRSQDSDQERQAGARAPRGEGCRGQGARAGTAATAAAAARTSGSSRPRCPRRTPRPAAPA